MKNEILNIYTYMATNLRNFPMDSGMEPEISLSCNCLFFFFFFFKKKKKKKKK